MIQLIPIPHSESASLTQIVDGRRREAMNKLDAEDKSAQGQFMTPRRVAGFMASLFGAQVDGDVRLLDAGAGVGSLTAAFVEEFLSHKLDIGRIAVTAYEIDSMLAEEMQDTLMECQHMCERAGTAFAAELLQQDFIEAGAHQLGRGHQLTFWYEPAHRFTHAILNPPYKKIHSESAHRRWLRSIGIETSNLYTGFLAVAIRLLEPGGELVAITPRSFCNGPYFKPFRELLLKEMSLLRIHMFESRTHAFKDDAVLQENIIFHAVKGQAQKQVTLSVSENAEFSSMQSRVVDFAQIVRPNDPDLFIHIITSEEEQRLTERMKALPCTLDDLGIDASTGPVVDFRLKAYLRHDPEPGTVPLIYPVHCRNHFVVWPVVGGKKPNAIVDAELVQKWLYPKGRYTIVRRFSSKEERRRIVATVYDLNDGPGEHVGFENHLNVFHCGREGLTPEVARGIAVYLNSTFVDVCFRQFNGHTQVNVKDLYNLRYPTLAMLEQWGKRVIGRIFPTQEEIDTWINKELF